MTEPKTTEAATETILEELIGSITFQSGELDRLRSEFKKLAGQVAVQTDAVMETKRHGQAVQKSVSWDKLGEHVFQGVAAGVDSKIEKTTKAARLLSDAADRLNASILTKNAETEQQRQLTNALVKATENYKLETRGNDSALRDAVRAADRLTAARRRVWLHSLPVAALAASASLFGGYWWAKANIEKGWYTELGAEMQSSSGQDYCGYMKGSVMTTENGGTWCGVWIKPDPKTK